MTNNILHGLTTIKDAIGIFLAVLVAGVANLIGAHGPEIKFLLVLMISDYASGLIVAGVFKKSTKSCSGGLESRAGLKGLFRKGWMLFIIYMSVQLDLLLKTEYVAMTVVFFFIANEMLSLLENVGLMGVKYPTSLKNAIEVLSKEKGAE